MRTAVLYIYIYIYIQCTTEEGDRVVENFGCVLIVILKFVNQHIIEFLSCFIYIYIYISKQTTFAKRLPNY